MEEECIQRVHQFLREYTEEGAGYRVGYITLKYHYFSWCESIGLRSPFRTHSIGENTYDWQELVEVLSTRYPYTREEGFWLRATGIVGLRMKHPVGLPPYYARRKSISKKVKEAVYAKLQSEGNVCALCGDLILADEKVHIDHIIPVRDGGLSDPSNLQMVHDLCNLGKG